MPVGVLPGHLPCLGVAREPIGFSVMRLRLHNVVRHSE